MDAPAISRTASWNSRCARVFLRVLPGFLGKLVLTSPPLSLLLSRRAAARLETGRTTTHGGPQERYPQRISGWYQSSAKEQPVRCQTAKSTFQIISPHIPCCKPNTLAIAAQARASFDSIPSLRDTGISWCVGEGSALFSKSHQ